MYHIPPIDKVTLSYVFAKTTSKAILQECSGSDSLWVALSGNRHGTVLVFSHQRMMSYTYDIWRGFYKKCFRQVWCMPRITNNRLTLSLHSKLLPNCIQLLGCQLAFNLLNSKLSKHDWHDETETHKTDKHTRRTKRTSAPNIENARAQKTHKTDKTD